jgi:hypothetical protein
MLSFRQAVGTFNTPFSFLQKIIKRNKTNKCLKNVGMKAVILPTRKHLPKNSEGARTQNNFSNFSAVKMTDRLVKVKLASQTS